MAIRCDLASQVDFQMGSLITTPDILNFRLVFALLQTTPTPQQCKVEKESGGRNQKQSSRRTFSFAELFGVEGGGVPKD